MIDTIEELEALYGTPSEAAAMKVQPHITPLYAQWINRAHFCVLSTIGPEGTDGSPRGDDGPVAQIVAPDLLLIPDWRGNNRLDSLRNIVRDGRVSLLFMVNGANSCVRINGTARLSADPEMVGRFEQSGKHPRSVICVTPQEVYSQCARALMRAQLWDGPDRSDGLPSVGDLLREARSDFDGAAYDAQWPGRAAKTMW